MIIDGFRWFVAALVVFGFHALFLLDWRREARDRLAQWAAYDAASQRRHDEFIVELRRARLSRSATDQKRGLA